VTGIPFSALVSSVLLLALVLLVVKGMVAARGVSSGSDESLLGDAAEFPPCPPEFVPRVFSPEDSQFVSGTRSPQLVKLFRSERKAVALVWVCQMSAAIQRAMREHAQIARTSEGLEFTTELKLFLRYGELMLICGVLFVAIQSAGPLWLGRMAVYVDAHSQRLVEAQQSFRAATSPRNLPRVGAL
jgi:hypothetical protein